MPSLSARATTASPAPPIWRWPDCAAAVTEEFHCGFRNSVASYTVSLLNPKVVADLRLHDHGLTIVERRAQNFLPAPDGSYLLTGEGRTLEHVAKLSAHDAERFPAFTGEMERIADVLRKLVLRPPPNLVEGFSLNALQESVAALVAVALALIRFYPSEDGRVETVRSFFGVHKIVTTSDGAYRVLMHGTTIHGAERLKNADGTPVTGRPEPITYYNDIGGIGQAINAVRARKGAPLRVAVIGLGSGTLTCQRKDNETWTFFEIDQSMVDTAKDPKYFTYIQQCEPDIKVVIGDARLTFAKEPDGLYDLIIVDAYSSDAIPIHLATEEAMEIYKAKLAPQGAVVMHVSNRHLDLASVVVGIAEANDLKSWTFNEDSGRDADYIFATAVVVSARDGADVGSINTDEKWVYTEADENQRVWTDDYSNILGALWRRLRDGE